MVSSETAKLAQEMRALGALTPLDYILAVMRDPKAEPERRDKMALAAVPFFHPKLNAIDATLTGKDGGPIETKSETSPEEIARRVAFILALGVHAKQEQPK